MIANPNTTHTVDKICRGGRFANHGNLIVQLDARLTTNRWQPEDPILRMMGDCQAKTLLPQLSIVICPNGSCGRKSVRRAKLPLRWRITMAVNWRLPEGFDCCGF